MREPVPIAPRPASGSFLPLDVAERQEIVHNPQVDPKGARFVRRGHIQFLLRLLEQLVGALVIATEAHLVGLEVINATAIVHVVGAIGSRQLGIGNSGRCPPKLGPGLGTAKIEVFQLRSISIGRWLSLGFGLRLCPLGPGPASLDQEMP